MTIDAESCYRALIARDARFDGVFFVGVKSTGIYCRPVCTAKTPGRTRCRFFDSAALAERAGFRPCLRCRPELAPGNAPVENGRTIAQAAAASIEAGALSDGRSLEDLAQDFALSSRQLRRLVQSELGVSPVQLAQTSRLLLAKKLLTETQLSMVQVALAAGFASVRRFNALFQSHYDLTPTSLRRSVKRTDAEGVLRLTLAYRPPFAWETLLKFLAVRAIPNVEQVHDSQYSRTVAMGEHHGWLTVAAVPGRSELCVSLAMELAPVLPAILTRLRNLFDLNARPDVIARHLSLDPHLAPLVKRWPGLRVPGAFDAFELGQRAILGQQVSVRGATTLAGRLAEKFGEPIRTPHAGLTRLTPTTESIATAARETIADIGLPSARAECLRQFACAIAQGDIDLNTGFAHAETPSRLLDLPGIGPWTAQYIAMRALRWPDAFPTGDLGLRKAARALATQSLEQLSEHWRPWRAYAAMYLWQSLTHSKE